MNLCKNCSTKTNNPTFCSRSCSVSFNNKNRKHTQETKDKIGKAILKRKMIICPTCNKEFMQKRTSSVFCSRTCASNSEIIRNKLQIAAKRRVSAPEEKKRLRDIGRFGGFGKKGYTKFGTRYDSILEEKCFELLEELNIPFIPHKNIPNSSKVSDIYLIDEDIYIELDGINREKKNKWLEREYKYWLDKLAIYKNNNLHYKIFYTFQEFKKYMED